MDIWDLSCQPVLFSYRISSSPATFPTDALSRKSKHDSTLPYPHQIGRRAQFPTACTLERVF